MSQRTRIRSAYGAVTAAYWAFMLTDGALRMLVLLHFHALGFTPVQLAYLFVLYEIAGIATNLYAGWIAARFGLTVTLYAGLSLQVGALLALSQLSEGWGGIASVVFVMAVQGLSGVAKDLTKMSSKSAIKLLSPDKNSTLFRWVALLTGAKNAIKGLGFLTGAALLALFGFKASVLGMSALLAVTLVLVVFGMPPGLQGGVKGTSFNEVFSTSPQVNRLSLARMFLFAARDVWFVVGIPIYFYAVLSDGTPEGNRIAFFAIGSFMAGWTILYGAVQALAPRLLAAKTAQTAEFVSKTKAWVGGLGLIPAALAAVLALAPAPAGWLTAVVIVALLAFGAVFALASSLHSFLILAFTSGSRVTMDVGFYYMANAAGRLLGTLLSGLSYQIGGLWFCLATASALVFVSWFATKRLEAL